MSVDNAVVRDLNIGNWLAPTEELIIWNGREGMGKRERNDCPRVMEEVTDLLPYIGLFDAWIAGAAQLPVPLTPLQAKEVKKGAVDAIYESRRRQPFWYTGSGSISYQFEATDEAVTGMTAAYMVSQTETGGGDTGTALAVLRGYHDRNVNRHNRNAAHISFWIYYNGMSWLALQTLDAGARAAINTDAEPYNWGTFVTAWYGINASLSPGHTHPLQLRNWALNVPYRANNSYGGFVGSDPSPWSDAWETIPPSIVDELDLGGGGVITVGQPIPWQPLYPTHQGQTIQPGVFAGALQYIKDRRIELNRVRALKRNAIDARPNTIADVISYPLGTDWPPL